MKLAGIEGGEDIVLELLLAAPGIDQHRRAERTVAPQLADEGAVDDPRRYRA